MCREDGRELFLTERLRKKQDIFEPITRMNLKSFVYVNKTVKVLTSKNKLEHNQ